MNLNQTSCGSAADAQRAQAELRYGIESDHRYPPGDSARFDIALELIGRRGRVLDVGAFDGQFSTRIRGIGNDVVALDVSERALELARRKGLPTVCCDLTKLPWPFEEASFDCVFAGEIIEHLVDTDAFLRECHRVLRSGGSLVLTTPNLASLGRRLMLLAGINPYIDTAVRKDLAGHVRYFVRSSLKLLLAENGFAVRELRGDYVSITPSGAGSRALAKYMPFLARGIVVRAVTEPVLGVSADAL